MNVSVLIVFILVPFFVQQEKNGVDFERRLSWEEVKAKAKAENRYIFLDIYATWCVPCRKMDKEVYINDSVGSYMNERFISVKVQWDSTAQDSKEVKNWYLDVSKLSRDYNIAALPSFLFFNPDGLLVYKDVGYKNVSDFIKLVSNALDPGNLLYYNQINDYINGKRDYDIMSDLAIKAKNFGNDSLARRIAETYINHLDKKELIIRKNIYFVRDILEDRQRAYILAKEYKEAYLDTLKADALLTEKNVEFFNEFNKLLKSKDTFFLICYLEPQKINQLMGSDVWADYFVQSVITNEEIESKLVYNKKPVFESPDWKEIQATIERKYPKVNAERLVLEYQILYYKVYDLNWQNWANYIDYKIQRYPPKADAYETLYSLNQPAWFVFLNNNDKGLLFRALKWVNLALKIEGKENSTYLDTKANLLYKLGRREEAILLEKRASALDPNNKGMRECLEKMKKGDPTWIVK